MRRRSSIGSIQAFLAQGEDAIEITKSRHPHYTRNAGPVSRSLLKNHTTNQSVAIYAPASDRKDQGPTPDVVADEYAAAHEKKMPLYQYLGGEDAKILPVPMMNIINGGSHADSPIAFQEFMIMPISGESFSESFHMGVEVFHCLKKILNKKKLSTAVGDEGGFAPNINSSSEVIETVLKSVEDAGFKPGKDIYLSLDVASTEFYKNNKYDLQGEKIVLSSDEMIKYLEKLVNAYPIYSIEDGMSEDDWDGWSNLTSTIGKKVQLVGDDLFVTNKKRLQKGILEGAGNSILVKVNQIGTLKETLESIKLAKENNFTTIISHRSGETEDTTIADLAVGVSAGQIKTGSLSRTDRTAKYNQLLRIEEALKSKAKYAGSSILDNY